MKVLFEASVLFADADGARFPVNLKIFSTRELKSYRYNAPVVCTVMVDLGSASADRAVELVVFCICGLFTCDPTWVKGV